MSDLLNQASLVMIPSGYKEDTVFSQLPQDGSGDLSFTRASNGTRVNSAGLVEVCPWNLLQNSETFDNATWQKAGIAVTANAVANPLTGLTNADNLVAENVTNFHYIYQPITYTTDQYTIFVYLKANGYNWFVIDSGLSNKYSYYNLSTGVLGTTGSGSTASMESVGNGWYKCGLTYAGVASSSGIYLSVRNADNGGSFTGNGTGGVLAYGAQLNIGSTAKPYFPTTDRLNVPRLTYQNGGGGCPSLLLEKQSTNYVKYSEDFTQSDWQKSGATITANSIISPDGTQNATRVQFSAGSRYVYQPITGVPAGSVTISCYIKGASVQKIGFSDGNANSNEITLTTDWQRYTFTFTYSSGGIGIQFDNYFGVTPSQETKDFYIWGAQLEASSYPTSYIPTTSSSATRVADACFKTGISSLIGQNEGVFFIDCVLNGTSTGGASNYGNIISTNRTANTTGAVSIIYSENLNSIIANYFNGNGSYTEIFSLGKSGINIGDRVKIAFAYKSGDSALYVNGTLSASSSVTFTPAGGMTDLFVDDVNIYYGYPMGLKVNEIVLSKTRLPNSELASLTTI